ncbi:MAG TPA: long-chain-fatty-acid--CoA ligase [Nitrososphaerales archaeon]|nr:long-chain-fatty-acid--CoA ligase [Nitrososphaerales archaeon]
MAEMAAPRYELTIDKILLQTLHRKSRQQIVYGKTRYDWVEFYDRIRRLASGLERMGVRKGTTVAVVDVDTNRYLEAYYAIPMMGATLHTVNIRLPPEHIGYTMAHAQDEFVMIRDEFVPLATKIAGSVKSLRGLVTMSDTGSAPSVPLMNVKFYDDLIAESDPHYEFPNLDEETRATIFYTSGTTGMPKGVWFTHRQLVLHTLATQIGLAGSLPQNRLEVRDVVMPLVPFFHVHSWGVPYGVGLNGQKTVLAGKYDPANILELISNEKVTWSNMVPTVLNMILSHPSVTKYSDALSKWKVSVGGGALPRDMALRAQKLGINVMAGYGLSETAPVLTLANPMERHIGMTKEELLDAVLLKTGIPIPLVNIRVVDADMKDVPRDSKTAGEIVVRGPWLTSEYYKDPAKTEELWRGGWLHTGDMAVIDQEGYVTIVDRIKDAVKSGGEWIPTIILEDFLLRHPAVAEAAVIGAKDRQWGERPLAVVALRQNQTASSEELKRHMEGFVAEGRIAKFWVPDSYVILQEQLPKTSTGKIDKKPLREKYSNAAVAH